jgi:O-antigen/teichoic acid export membrane protein
MSYTEDIRHILAKYLPANSLRARFVSGMMWVTAGSLSRQSVNFIVGVIVARIIGVREFGKLAVIQTTILLLAELGQAGIGFSATRYVASSRDIDLEKTGRIIGFAFISTLFCALFMGFNLSLFSSKICSFVLPNQDLSREIRLASMWVIFEMINVLQIRILNGFEAFQSCAIYSLCQAVLQLPLAILGAHYAGLVGIIVSFSSVSIVSCVVGQIILRRECRRHNISITYRNIWEERGMLRMSTMVAICSIAMNLTNWLVGIMVAKQPNGMLEFGLFNAAARFQSILLFLPLKINDVTVPVLANLQTQGNRRGFTKALAGAICFTVTVTSGGALLAYFYADQLMTWYGAEFASGAPVLRIVVFGAVASAVWTILTAGLWAAERATEMVVLDIVRGSLLLGLCLAGYAISAHNLALAYLYSYTVGVLLVLVVLLRYIRYRWSTRIIAETPTTC